MRPDTYVVLPDGRLEQFDVPSDVPLEPIALPVVSQNRHIQSRYESMRLNGQSHNIADVLANRSFCAVRTDAIFNEGKFSGDSGKIGQKELWLQAEAKKHGVSTNGKWYCSGLADFPGDPKAWIDSRGDVLRVAKEKNMTVQGYVDHKGHETDGGDDLPIADDLVSGEVADIIAANPGIDAQQVYADVYALRSGAVDPNPLLVQE